MIQLKNSSSNWPLTFFRFSILSSQHLFLHAYFELILITIHILFVCVCGDRWLPWIYFNFWWLWKIFLGRECKREIRKWYMYSHDADAEIGTPPMQKAGPRHTYRNVGFFVVSRIFFVLMQQRQPASVISILMLEFWFRHRRHHSDAHRLLVPPLIIFILYKSIFFPVKQTNNKTYSKL